MEPNNSYPYYPNHPSYPPQADHTWSSQEAQEGTWPSAHNHTSSHHPSLSMDPSRVPRQSLGVSESYAPGMSAQLYQPSASISAHSHTQSTTAALDLAGSAHSAHLMTGFNQFDAFPAYTPPGMSRPSRHGAYGQQQSDQQMQPYAQATPQPHAQPVRQSLGASHSSTYPASLPQPTIHDRRMASMPSRRGTGSLAAAAAQTTQTASAEFDFNAEMQQAIGSSSVSSSLSPEQAPLISPPLSIASAHSSSRPPVSGSSTASAAKSKGQSAKKNPAKRKKIEVPDDDEEGDDEDDFGESGKKEKETKRACRRCKLQKIKCNFSPGQRSCDKCKNHNVSCMVDPTKPSRNPNKKEYFLAQIREKDAIIESLIKEKYNPYTATPLSVKSFRETVVPGSNVLGFLGKLQEGAMRPLPGSDFTFRNEPHSYSSSDEEDQVDENGAERDSPLEVAYPIAMLEKLHVNAVRHPSARSTSSAEETAVDEENVGPPNPAYFAQASVTVTDDYIRSNLILHGLVTRWDVEKLFDIYHTKLNVFIPLLDRELHTPEETFRRCPCLFTVVCAITSRYYDEKKDLYPVAMHFAKNECADALMHGLKSVGLAQAFLLLAMYHNPAKRWEEERAYLYAGLAMRISIDLNLHLMPVVKPSASEKEEREMLDRLRLWMICYETDWNMAAHYGKPASVGDSQIILTSDEFWHCSRYNLVGDIGLAAYNRLLRTVSEFHTKAYSDPSSRTGLNKTLDFRKMYGEFSQKLEDVEVTWRHKFSEYHAFDKDPVNYEIYQFRSSLLPYATNYCRLVMGCFGFQQTFEKGKPSLDRDFLNKCRLAATEVVVAFINNLAPSGFMRYAPNGWFNFCSFACAFLIKLIRPEFSGILYKEEEEEIVALVYQLITTLRDGRVALDERHTPRLWARFLEGLMAKRCGTRTAPHRTDIPATGQPTASAQYSTVNSMDVTSQLYPPMDSSTAPMGYYYQWSDQGVPPADVASGSATTQNAMYAPLPEGYHMAGGFYQPSAVGASVDDDMRMAITAPLDDGAPFWQEGNLMMPGFPAAWTESPPSAISDLSDPQSFAQWFPSGFTQ